MKLVESDVPDKPTGEVPAPAPPRRKVAVSLVFTFSVLVTTVVVVYTAVPKRNNAALSVAIEQHRATELDFDLKAPSLRELRAWSLGIHGESAPWPKWGDGVRIVGAGKIELFRRPVSVASLEVSTGKVTVMALRARDVPPRRRRQSADELVAQSWRSGRWTLVAVGRADQASAWRPLVGVK